MITDKLIMWLVSMLDELDIDLGTFRVPDWLDSASGYAGVVFGLAGAMGHWLDFQLAGSVAGGVFLSLIAGFLIKLGRSGQRFSGTMRNFTGGGA